MRATEALKKIMGAEGYTYKSLAEMLGRPATTLSDRLQHDNISMEKLNEMAKAMGYKVMLVPYAKGKESYEVE